MGPTAPARHIREFLRVSFLFFPIFRCDSWQNYVRMIWILIKYRGSDYPPAISGGILGNDNRPSIELTVSGIAYTIGYLDGLIRRRYIESINRNVGFSRSFQEYVMWNSSGRAPSVSA